MIISITYEGLLAADNTLTKAEFKGPLTLEYCHILHTLSMRAVFLEFAQCSSAHGRLTLSDAFESCDISSWRDD